MARAHHELPITTALDMATISELLGHGLQLTSALGAVRSAKIPWSKVRPGRPSYLTVSRDAGAPQGWVGKVAPKAPYPILPGNHAIDLAAVAERVIARLQP